MRRGIYFPTITSIGECVCLALARKRKELPTLSPHVTPQSRPLCRSSPYLSGPTLLTGRDLGSGVGPSTCQGHLPRVLQAQDHRCGSIAAHPAGRCFSSGARGVESHSVERSLIYRRRAGPKQGSLTRSWFSVATFMSAVLIEPGNCLRPVQGVCLDVPRVMMPRGRDGPG